MKLVDLQSEETRTEATEGSSPKRAAPTFILSTPSLKSSSGSAPSLYSFKIACSALEVLHSLSFREAWDKRWAVGRYILFDQNVSSFFLPILFPVRWLKTYVYETLSQKAKSELKVEAPELCVCVLRMNIGRAIATTGKVQKGPITTQGKMYGTDQKKILKLTDIHCHWYIWNTHRSK